MSLEPKQHRPQATNANKKKEPLVKPSVEQMNNVTRNDTIQKKEEDKVSVQKKINKNIQKKEGKDVADKAESNDAELTKDERVELRRITGNRIDKAYTDFVDAASQVKSEIHESAKAQIDFMSFMAEIALGIMLPGAGKALASWADKIPSSASNASFLAAYALLDRGQTTAYLSAGTKVGSNALKKGYKNLSGLSKTDAFIAKMKEDTRNGFDKTDSNLPNLSDKELASLYLAFGTELTNATTYKAKIRKTIKRFKQQVLSIGYYTSSSTTAPPSETSHTVGVYWLEYEPKKIVLANVTLMQKKHPTRSIGGPRDSTKMTFNHLVDKDMGPLAEKVGKAEQNGKVKQLTYAGVKKLKGLNLISNYPKKFPSNKYYKTTN